MGVSASIILGGVGYSQQEEAQRDAKKDKKKGEAKLAADKKRVAESTPFGAGTKAGTRIAAEKSLISRRAGSYAKTSGSGGLG